MRQLVQLGGGGFSMERSPAMDDYLFDLALARAAADGRDRPRICFLPTASGDADHYLVKFYRRFAGLCEATHLSCFRREKFTPHPGEHLLAQDMVYVGGGSVLSLIGTWHAHGWPLILQTAYEQGTIMCGLSAGALCWGGAGLSRFNPWPQHFTGLGFVPHSLAVHYDNEAHRREEYQQAIARGEIEPGYGLSDGTALHFVDEQLSVALTTKHGALAAWVAPDGEGGAAETPIECTLLAEADPGPSAEEEWRAAQRHRRGHGRDG